MIGLDLFDLHFDNDLYKFTRPLKDMNPYQYVERDDGTGLLVLNTLGISQDDIKIDIKPSYSSRYTTLSIEGKTERNDKIYSVNITFRIMTPVKSIEWSSKDGITEMTIFYERPELPKVNVIRK